MNNGVQGIQGETGNGIASIQKTGTSGLVDTYTITYTNGNTTTFTVSNGKGISSIVKTGSAGLVDNYRITYNDGTYFDYTVTNGQDGEVTEEELQDVYEQMSSELEDGTLTGTSIDTSDSAYWKAEIGLIGNTSQATSIIPTEYQQVEYIESTGTQYIDTTAKLSQIYGYDIDFESTEFIDNNFNLNGIFGTNNVGGDLKIWFTNTTDGARNSTSYRGSSITLSYVPLETYLTRHNIKVINNNCYYDNTLIGTYSNLSEIANDINTYIFAMNEGIDVKFYSKTKLYHLKIYGNNNVLVRDFIPCYRKSDNEIGLYDLVNGVFYTNDGTGTFLTGNDVSIPNPNYPQDIQVVKGSNNVKIYNKNALNISNSTINKNGFIVKIENNHITITSTGTNSTINLNSLTNISELNNKFSNKQITFSIKNLVNTGSDIIYPSQIYFSSSNNSYYLQPHNDTNTVTKTLISKLTTLSLYLPAGTYNSSFDLQFEEGSTSTSYVAHQEQNYPIILPTGMELCKIRNNQDYIYKNIVDGNWYKHSEIEKFGMNTLANLFDNITYFQSNFNSNNGIISLRLYKDLFSNLNIKNVSFNNYYNEKLKSQNGGWNGVNSKNHFANIDGLTIWLYYTDLGLNEWTVGEIPDLSTKLTTYFGDTNFYLPLRTPIDTQITDTTLINQLNDIEKKLKTYQGVSHITQTNEDMPFILTLDYKKSNLLRIKALENA